MQNRKNARIILYICVIHIADNSNNTNNDNDYWWEKKQQIIIN